ncbi:uracil-DNA glycosylase family protein [uncultured Shewanella sp.]|uniref:uracil-DNA glycosylase family protein n=1 Tax=uncultured Shewanella sp. TaxID=173975 RepID=UPI00260508FD|nr:uracil-DNA glycosylase family protein [uncultured Shewanella sp.]
MDPLLVLKENVKQCDLCAAALPLGPKPIIQMGAESKILIAGQAPGKKAHEKGMPFDDASGDRLRTWLGVSKVTFYDEAKFAILPMGFCYPGKGKTGDLPPQSECAVKWRAGLLHALSGIQLTIVVGQYAMAYHLPEERQGVTQAVTHWKLYWPKVIPLPHPSPRNNIWLKRHPWFEAEILPSLKARVRDILSAG